MKKAIYTCIVGGYDLLLQPRVVDPSFDYICFSDDFAPEERIGVWQIRPIPYDDPDPTRKSRYAKLQPHKVLPDHDLSLWIDSNIEIAGQDFYAALDAAEASGCLVAQVPHFGRDCIYDEIRTCFDFGIISFWTALRQNLHLKLSGFPRHQGMFENNLILRRHNDPMVVAASDLWWEEYRTYSHRDQLSLMFVYWKLSLRPVLLFGEGRSSRNVPFLKYRPHRKGLSVTPRRTPTGLRKWWKLLLSQLLR